MLRAFNGLLLGLGAVALLVGAVGVANIMIVTVLERRSEIGLRRAPGATRSQNRTQFLSDAILLALLGGTVGAPVGALATTVYAPTKHWAVSSALDATAPSSERGTTNSAIVLRPIRRGIIRSVAHRRMFRHRRICMSPTAPAKVPSDSSSRAMKSGPRPCPSLRPSRSRRSQSRTSMSIYRWTRWFTRVLPTHLEAAPPSPAARPTIASSITRHDCLASASATAGHDSPRCRGIDVLPIALWRV